MDITSKTPSEKKVIVISGAFGYLGRAVAKKLATEKYSLALLYKDNPEEEVSRFVKEIQELGAEIYAYKCDLSEEDDVLALLNNIEQKMGKIYGCVHTAGIAPTRKSLLATSTQDVDIQMKGNLIPGFILLTKCADRFKKSGQGVIVGVTTAGVVIEKAAVSLGAYVLAKFALQGLLAGLKQELEKTSVRVYSIAPGFMPGGMNSDIPKAFVEMIKAKSISGKITSPEDVAEKIAYLIGEEGNKETKLTFCIAGEYEGSEQ